MRARDRIEWLESIPEIPPLEEGVMHYAGANGNPREYRGPLRDLGYGIPRPRSRRPFVYRMQRALWHLAFGYVSGFPVRAVLAFTVRGFWRIPLPDDPIPYAIVELDDEPADAMLECPHWEPGRITLRKGCTACAAERRDR